MDNRFDSNVIYIVYTRVRVLTNPHPNTYDNNSQSFMIGWQRRWFSVVGRKKWIAKQ